MIGACKHCCNWLQRQNKFVVITTVIFLNGWFSCCRTQKSDQKPDIELYPPFDLPSFENIDDELAEPLFDGDSIEVIIPSSTKKQSIRTCNDFLKLPRWEYETVDQMSYMPLLYSGIRCVALEWTRSLKPAPRSLLGDFWGSPKTMKTLPPYMNASSFNDENREKRDRAISRCEQWDKFESNLEIALKDKAVFDARAEGWNATIELYARGDFNNDGYEDIMIRRDGGPEGGTLALHALYIFTKTEKDNCYRVIKQLLE